jgi:hypothetical protein
MRKITLLAAVVATLSAAARIARQCPAGGAGMERWLLPLGHDRISLV